MIGLIYEWLKIKLPIELVDIIIGYHHELMYRDVMNTLRSYISSYSIAIEPHYNHSMRTMSRLVFKNPLNNHLTIVQYYFFEYTRIVYNRYNAYERNDIHMQKSYKTSNKRYHMQSDPGAMNRRREWLHGMQCWTKEQLIAECKKNGLKVFKSWKNVKLINALLKA